MTITQYNYNNSLTAEFKWASFQKRSNSEKKKSMTQILFRTRGPNIQTDPKIYSLPGLSEGGLALTQLYS